jgi:hypothetical protein
MSRDSLKCHESGVTMIPIFFPYTYIPPETADLLQACFSRLAVLQPLPGRLPEDMQSLQASGWLDLRAPIGIDASRLEETIRGVRTWAELNRGRRGLDTGFSHSTGNRIPLFDDTVPSRLRDAIRSQGGSAPRATDTAVPLVTDLVFLNMAEQFDVQSRTVSEDFDGLKRMEAELFNQLHGKENAIQWPGARQPSRQHPESAGYMLAERLAAWRRVMGASYAPGQMPAVAVTVSRPVVEDLIEATGILREALRLENVPLDDPAAQGAGQAWRLELDACLRTLATGATPPCAPAPALPTGSGGPPQRLFSIRLYVAAGVDLWHLLDAERLEAPCRASSGEAPHAVIVLVQG